MGPPNQPGRPVIRPPRPRDRLSVWLLLLLTLALTCPVLLLDIHRPEVTEAEEALTLAASVQTHARLFAHPPASWFVPDSLTPYLGDVPQWRLPPAVAWIQLLVFRARGLDPATTPIERYVTLARLSAVAMGLLAIAGVFWAGMSLGGLRTAGFAALVCATSPAFIYQARLASPPIYYTAWYMLSIAAALWALRPQRHLPTIARQAVGWGLCGLAMGMAVLTAGPGALLSIALPILTVVVICPNRISHVLGLLASVLLAALTVLPWAAFAHQQDAEAWSMNWMLWIPLHWLDFRQLMSVAGWRGLLLLVGLLPWTLWLLGAVAQPFSTSSAGTRTRMFLGWGWFLWATVILLGAATTGWRCCLTAAIAVSAVLIAQLFTQYINLAAAGRHARLWRLLRWPHLVLLALASVGMGMVLGAQPYLIGQGLLPSWVAAANLGWFYAGGATLALLGVVALSTHWAWMEFPSKSISRLGRLGFDSYVGFCLPLYPRTLGSECLAFGGRALG